MPTKTAIRIISINSKHRVRPGGLILAHNVKSSRAYSEKVTTNPRLETVFYTEGNDLGVTLKKL